ncbi:hypothetical protein TrCOL_g8341 [Triparma columacea]|uniref:Uncharacterized protein n=1 Tax=Triparma columacea TaxID=722753 RepID=A0A9W7G0W8_9STRA|nr:hypothetical protein TrCOL_g8341 [Triparma columacea]
MRACPTIQVLIELKALLGANVYFMNARPSHANCVRDYDRAYIELSLQLGAIRNLIPHTPVELIGLSAAVKHALVRINMVNHFPPLWTFASFDSHIGGIAHGFWFNYPAGSFVDIAAFRHNVLHSFSPAVADAFGQVFYINNNRQYFRRPIPTVLLTAPLPQGYQNVLLFPIDIETNGINQLNPYVGGGYYGEGETDETDNISHVYFSPLEKSNNDFIFANMSDEDKVVLLAAAAGAAREKYANMSDEDKVAWLASRREKYANMSEEDKATLLAAAREKYANLSDEDKVALLAAAREKYANLSDEDKVAWLAYKREWYAKMSDKDKATFLASKKSSNMTSWTKEEDKKLSQAVKSSPKSDWMIIASKVGSRDNMQCRQRWMIVLDPGIIKGSWTTSLDEQLIKAVNEEGIKNWGSLALKVPGRTNTQCRARWKHHLDPNINKAPFSEEEDKIVLDLHAKIGNKWAEISKSLSNRTKESVQNRWKCMERMKKKKRKKEEKEEKEKEKRRKK